MKRMISTKAAETAEGIKDFVKQNGKTTEFGGNVEIDGNLAVNGNFITKISKRLNLSDFTANEGLKTFTLNQTAIDKINEIISTAFETDGVSKATLYIGTPGIPYANYYANFSNDVSGNQPYISFSNPNFSNEDLTSILNVLIKPIATAQKICSDFDLYNVFVQNDAYLIFDFYKL